jgi:hypothetical protein
LFTLGDADHDLLGRHLRQRGRGVPRPDVGDLAQGIELKFLQISNIVHS